MDAPLTDHGWFLVQYKRIPYILTEYNEEIMQDFYSFEIIKHVLFFNLLQTKLYWIATNPTVLTSYWNKPQNPFQTMTSQINTFKSIYLN